MKTKTRIVLFLVLVFACNLHAGNIWYHCYDRTTGVYSVWSEPLTMGDNGHQWGWSWDYLAPVGTNFAGVVVTNLVKYGQPPSGYFAATSIDLGPWRSTLFVRLKDYGPWSGFAPGPKSGIIRQTRNEIRFLYTGKPLHFTAPVLPPPPLSIPMSKGAGAAALMAKNRTPTTVKAFGTPPMPVTTPKAIPAK